MHQNGVGARFCGSTFAQKSTRTPKCRPQPCNSQKKKKSELRASRRIQDSLYCKAGRAKLDLPTATIFAKNREKTPCVNADARLHKQSQMQSIWDLQSSHLEMNCAKRRISFPCDVKWFCILQSKISLTQAISLNAKSPRLTRTSLASRVNFGFWTEI